MWFGSWYYTHIYINIHVPMEKNINVYKYINKNI